MEHEIKLFGTKDSYWKWLIDTLTDKRDKLAKMVEAAGMVPIIPEGGYFMMADMSPLSKCCFLLSQSRPLLGSVDS